MAQNPPTWPTCHLNTTFTIQDLQASLPCDHLLPEGHHVLKRKRLKLFEHHIDMEGPGTQCKQAVVVGVLRDLSGLKAG